MAVQRLVLFAVVLAAVVAIPAAQTGAATTPNGTEYHPLTFPVQEKVTYFDDFGGVRNHPGNDLMGAKLDHELAANDGTVTFARSDSSGHSGNMLILTGTDGWKYWYIHINNDTPGTDDGKNPAQWRFAPGVKAGAKVKRGQFIAYMGDSGEAETTAPHLHFELHRPNDTYIDPYTSLRLSQGAGANGLCSYPNSPVPHPSPASGQGYWTLATNGKVLPFGVTSFGSAPAPPAINPYIGLAATASDAGYWVTDLTGVVRTFGDAKQYGGMGGKRLNAPIISMTPTATGKGYWLLARDGGIFGYGDARFYGSTGSLRLNSPIISMAATPGGHGYWLLGGDGGIFGYGDARFYGSTGSYRLKQPVTAMSALPDGTGYWLVGRDGSVYNFGAARDFGSTVKLGWCAGPTALSISTTATGHGYWVLLSDGQIATFGDAKQYGQPSTTKTRAVAFAAVF
jgi:murein DD-endopeptidase MepM/ murein hydrolase activator NlpD